MQMLSGNMDEPVGMEEEELRYWNANAVSFDELEEVDKITSSLDDSSSLGRPLEILPCSDDAGTSLQEFGKATVDTEEGLSWQRSSETLRYLDEEGAGWHDLYSADSNLNQSLSLRDPLDELPCLDSMEASLQDFSSSWSCDSCDETLFFQTLKKPGSNLEVEEIMSVFGNTEQMRYYSSEIPIVGWREALQLQARLREEISFFGKRKAITWKLFRMSNEAPHSKTVFVGFISLYYESRVLDPGICLKREYTGKGIGTKACLSLLLKLLSNKEWLVRHIDGIELTINPENGSSLALKERVLAGFSVEQLCKEHTKGYWHYTRRAYCNNSSNVVVRRKFVCANLLVLESLLMSKTVQKVGRQTRFLRDDEEKKQYLVYLKDKYGKYGVRNVHLYSQDVERLAREILWCKLRGSRKLEVPVANTFSLAFPNDLYLKNPKNEVFFLLLFIDEMTCQLQEFDVMKVDRTRERVLHRFFAFSHLTAEVKHLKVRICGNKAEEFESVAGYLLMLHIAIFEQERNILTVDLRSHLQGFWTTGPFTYYRRKRKRKHMYGSIVSLHEEAISLW